MSPRPKNFEEREALKCVGGNRELRSKRKPRELARYLTCFAQGLGVTGKMGGDPGETKKVIDIALSHL